MLYAYLGLVTLLLWIFSLIDLVTSDDSEIRTMAKTAWLFVILLVPLIGSIGWLVAGRPLAPDSAYQGSIGSHDRPGRHLGRHNETDEEFLRRCRERAEAQRREWKRQQREAGES